MNGERLGFAALCAALVAVGALAWWLQLRPGLVAEPAPLATLPHAIDGWRGEDVPLDAVAESVLRADFNLQRTYQHATGSILWLYVGYYGTARGGRPEHTPRGCYTGAGWGIARARTLEIGAGRRVREYLVERPGERRLVHYWYRSSRRTGMSDGLDQNLDRLRGRLGTGRADGALITLSTPLDDDEESAARSRLLSFGSALDPLLGERWPNERPSRGASG